MKKILIRLQITYTTGSYAFSISGLRQFAAFCQYCSILLSVYLYFLFLYFCLLCGCGGGGEVGEAKRLYWRGAQILRFNYKSQPLKEKKFLSI